MRIDEVIRQCSAPGEEIIWARKGKREAVVYHKSLVYFAEKGLVDAIRGCAQGTLKKSDKLDKYFLLAERMEKGTDMTEGFVSERKTSKHGVDALCIESLDGRKKWIDKDYTDHFTFCRKYLFDDSGWNQNMVIIEEEGVITGIIMTLEINE